MISDTAWSACSVGALHRMGVPANPVEKACAFPQQLPASPCRLCKWKASSLMPTTHLPSNPKTECQDWTVPALAALPSVSTWGGQVRRLKTAGRSAGQEAVEAHLKSSLLTFPIQPCHSGCPESLSGLSLKLVKKEPRQLELTWAGSRPRNPGGNLSYELHVLNQVRKHHSVFGVHPDIPSLGYRIGGNTQNRLSQDRHLQRILTLLRQPSLSRPFHRSLIFSHTQPH